MNINLSGLAAQSNKKQGKKKIGFGLNQRKKNVFEEDEDDDHDVDNVERQDSAKSRREAVNREIAAEQEALRKRALKSMEQQDSSSAAVYDYDAAYDSFQPPKEEKDPNQGDDGPQKSRYVEDMLKQSKRRAIERDIVYERKVARDQEEESGQADFEGKDKFVTKAYQRKLEERRRSAEESAKQLAREEHDDVTKKGGGAAIASFYGNFSRNVAMGAATTTELQANDLRDEEADRAMDKPTELGAAVRNKVSKSPGPRGDLEGSRGDGHSNSNTGRSSVEDDHRRNSQNSDREVPGSAGETKPPSEDLSPAEKNLRMRQARAEKLAKARIRYFQRNGIPLEAGLASL